MEIINYVVPQLLLICLALLRRVELHLKNVCLSCAGFYQRIFYRSAIIQNNRRYLTDNMQQPDFLINHLISTNCLPYKQAMSIAERRRNTDKNWELLDVIGSLPLEKYFLFLECLRFKGQHNIADVIDKGGGNSHFE